MTISGAERYPVYTAQTDGIDSATKRSSVPHVPSLRCHAINGNNYRVKKVRGKIKTNDLSLYPLNT